jgi:hypothetical protein
VFLRTRARGTGRVLGRTPSFAARASCVSYQKPPRALSRAASRLQRLPGPLTAEKLDGGDGLLRDRIIKVRLPDHS